MMTVHSVLAIPMEVAGMVAPARILSTYGVGLPPMGVVVYQFWGAAPLALGLLTWVARGVEEMRVKKGFSLVLAITTAISCGMTVRGQSAGANDVGSD